MLGPPCFRSLKTAHENGLGIGTVLFRFLYITSPPIEPEFETELTPYSVFLPTNSIALAFELLTPLEVCAAFSTSLHRPVHYIHSPVIEISVPIPAGYRAQLQGVEQLFGRHNAPYFGPDITAPDEARCLWAGWRGIEEYAREVFPVEEAANGMAWMHDGDVGK